MLLLYCRPSPFQKCSKSTRRLPISASDYHLLYIHPSSGGSTAPNSFSEVGDPIHLQLAFIAHASLPLVNPAFLDYLYRLPLVHIIVRFLSVSWSLLQILCSLLMVHDRFHTFSMGSSHFPDNPRVSSLYVLRHREGRTPL